MKHIILVAVFAILSDAFKIKVSDSNCFGIVPEKTYFRLKTINCDQNEANWTIINGNVSHLNNCVDIGPGGRIIVVPCQSQQRMQYKSGVIYKKLTTTNGSQYKCLRNREGKAIVIRCKYINGGMVFEKESKTNADIQNNLEQCDNKIDQLVNDITSEQTKFETCNSTSTNLEKYVNEQKTYALGIKDTKEELLTKVGDIKQEFEKSVNNFKSNIDTMSSMTEENMSSSFKNLTIKIAETKQSLENYIDGKFEKIIENTDNKINEMSTMLNSVENTNSLVVGSRFDYQRITNSILGIDLVHVTMPKEKADNQYSSLIITETCKEFTVKLTQLEMYKNAEYRHLHIGWTDGTNDILETYLARKDIKGVIGLRNYGNDKYIFGNLNTPISQTNSDLVPLNKNDIVKLIKTEESLIWLKNDVLIFEYKFQDGDVTELYPAISMFRYGHPLDTLMMRAPRAVLDLKNC